MPLRVIASAALLLLYQRHSCVYPCAVTGAPVTPFQCAARGMYSICFRLCLAPPGISLRGYLRIYFFPVTAFIVFSWLRICGLCFCISFCFSHKQYYTTDFRNVKWFSGNDPYSLARPYIGTFGLKVQMIYEVATVLALGFCTLPNSPAQKYK